MKDGGPAYPGTWGQFTEVSGQIGTEGGMTMRQAYKLAALQGLLAIDYGPSWDQVVQKCGELADAMIEEDERHD